MPLDAKSIYPITDPLFVQFASRRSVVHSTNGMVASTQPLASEAGQRILKMGGNAADAAVAVAAALNMTEPASTGIGGDMFCLFYDAKTGNVRSLNGSGRSAKNTSLERLRKDLEVPTGNTGKVPILSAHAVTVPGAAAGWVDTVEKFGSGKVTLEQILMPAIELGEKGFPVSELSAGFWLASEQMLKDASPNYRELLKDDRNAELFARAPRAGEIFRNPHLARTFRTLATEGKKGFYTGRIAQEIVSVIKLLGGHLEMSDLENHLNIGGSEETQPISMQFSGQGIHTKITTHHNDPPKDAGDRSASTAAPSPFVEIWEHPPNGQGIVALMTLGIIQELEKTRKLQTFSVEDHNSVPYIHALIECLRISFADASWWVTDPDHSPQDLTKHLLSSTYLTERAKLFDPTKAQFPSYGQPGPSPAQNHCDTVYFAVTDAEGNGMSFINSLYTGFGSCIIPAGTGMALQNRGANFVLGPKDHPNLYAPGKRPYHTIIPGMITVGGHEEGSEGRKRELHSVFGVMGGFMQPQGQVQVLMNQEVFGMNPQQALDAPRICIGAGMPAEDKDGTSDDKRASDPTVYLEEGIDDAVVEGLKKMGHDVHVLKGWKRGMFGRGQIIRKHVDVSFDVKTKEETRTTVWSAGSDPRGDGCAIPA